VTGAAARLCVLGAALLFSTGGAAIKGTSLDSWQTAGFRSGVAALTLLALLPDARRVWNWRVWPVGAAYAATLILFVHANKLTTAANAIFLQATAPAYLLLIGPLVLGEPVRRRDAWYIAALAAGMALFFLGAAAPVRTAPDPARGNVYGVLSGLAYAITLAGLRYLSHTPGGGGGLAPVAVGNVLAFAFCLPPALPVAGAGAADAAVILYLGILQIGLAYWLLTRGLRQVSAFESSTLLLLEPVCNPVWTWALHAERPGTLALAGGAIILASTLAHLRTARD
jgi:drug/metabolite transporter (DMT)-like permease